MLRYITDYVSKSNVPYHILVPEDNVFHEILFMGDQTFSGEPTAWFPTKDDGNDFAVVVLHEDGKYRAQVYCMRIYESEFNGAEERFLDSPEYDTFEELAGWIVTLRSFLLPQLF